LFVLLKKEKEKRNDKKLFSSPSLSSHTQIKRIGSRGMFFATSASGVASPDVGVAR